MASTTWRTIGRPSTGAAACSGRPMRRDCPAASTSAATRAGAAPPASPRAAAAGSGSRSSRPPTPMPMMSSPGHRDAGSEPLAAPSRSRSLGRAAAAGQAQHRRARRCAPAAAGCRDRPACRSARPAPPAASIAAGSTSLAVGDRRGAGDQQQIAGARRRAPLGAAPGRRLVGAARLADQPPPVGGDPLGGDPRRSCPAPWPRCSGSSVWISARAPAADRARAGPGPASAAIASTALEQSARGSANGMILIVATIWPGSTTACAGKVREGHRLVDHVEPVDPRRVDHQHAACRRDAGWPGR